MNPITHALMGWTVASTVPSLDKRDRMIVTLAAVVPDIDGLGMIPEILTRDSSDPILWWTDYHHVIAHNLGTAIVVGASALALGRRRMLTCFLALVSFHLHLLGDLVGARGPDDYSWPIPYLLPFSDRWPWVWEGQWYLNAWPNMALTSVLLASALTLAWERGFSPVGLVSESADRVFVATLRSRFGEPGVGAEERRASLPVGREPSMRK